MNDNTERRSVCMRYVSDFLAILGPPGARASHVLVLVDPDDPHEKICAVDRTHYIAAAFGAAVRDPHPYGQRAAAELDALADPPAPPDAMRFVLDLGGGHFASVVATYQGGKWAVCS